MLPGQIDQHFTDRRMDGWTKYEDGPYKDRQEGRLAGLLSGWLAHCLDDRQTDSQQRSDPSM